MQLLWTVVTHRYIVLLVTRYVIHSEFFHLYVIHCLSLLLSLNAMTPLIPYTVILLGQTLLCDKFSEHSKTKQIFKIPMVRKCLKAWLFFGENVYWTGYPVQPDNGTSQLQTQTASLGI